MAPRYTRQYGNQTVTLIGDDQGMQRMIADSMMHKGLVPVAEAIRARAAATAPKGTGRYSGNFSVDTGTGRGTVGKGTGRPTRYPRAYARVSNDVKYAFYLEYGNRRFKAHRTLRKAAGITRFNATGDKYG